MMEQVLKAPVLLAPVPREMDAIIFFSSRWRRRSIIMFAASGRTKEPATREKPKLLNKKGRN